MGFLNFYLFVHFCVIYLCVYVTIWLNSDISDKQLNCLSHDVVTWYVDFCSLEFNFLYYIHHFLGDTVKMQGSYFEI